MALITALHRFFGLQPKKKASSPKPPEAAKEQAAREPDKAPVKELVARTGLPSERMSASRRAEFMDLLDELGSTKYSPNKRWSVGYRDPGPDPSMGRKNFVRLRDNETRQIVALVTTLARPFEAAVSDTGVFAVVDAGDAGQLSGELLVFDRTGFQIYKRAYCANLVGIGISNCGRYAACLTANSSNDDSFIFEIHDVQEQKVLASRTPVTGLVADYLFETVDGELKKVFISVPSLGKFAYSASGEFLDTAKFLTARLTKGDYATRIMAAQELLTSDGSEKTVQRAMAALESAIPEATGNPVWLASAYRLQGELFETQGRSADAMAAYRTALEQYPKVGVKRRLAALEKQAAQKKSAPDEGAEENPEDIG